MSINQAPVLTTGDANGVVKLDFGSYNANAPRVVVQADGKIVVNGYVVASAGSDVRSELVRYNADGSPDTTFGTDGIVASTLSPATTRADVAIQADGKIVVTDSDYTVTRYNSDGSLDTSFGSGGIAATTLDYFASSVLVQADGKIVVSGSDFELARYDGNGNLDPSFGVGGKVSTSFNGQGLSLAAQPDGKLIVAGNVSTGVHDDFAVARYNIDGSLDASFGAGGEVSTSFGPTNNDAYSMTLQADGKIVVAGASDFSKHLALVRYNVDGSLDASFGSGGKLTTTVPDGFGEAAKSVKIQPDGKIVVAGYSFIGGNNTDFVLVRYNSDGSLDSSFGTGGKVTTELGSRADAANSIVLLSDGKILVVGTTGEGPFGTAPDQPGADFALARYNSDGSLDTSFGAATALNGPAFFIEDTIPTVLNARATVHDAELDAANSYAGASLTLERHGGANTADVFGASGNLAALTEGGDITLSGVAIGTVTQNAGGTLVLTFGAVATEARVNEAMRDITYTNSSENPTGAARIDWSFSDGNAGAQGSGGALAATGFTTVNLTPVNDEPVLTVPGPLNTLADVDLAITGLSVSDLDSASLTTIVSVSHGTLTATGVSGSGTKELFLQGSVAQINAALSHVVYHSAAAFSGADKLTITTIDQAGTPSAIVSDDVTLNVTAVPGSVSINDVTISEGDSGAKVATFTVTRSGGTAPIEVDFATADGSATTADNDYVATSGTLHFGAGVKTQTVSVTINGDGTFESNEAFSVNLSNATHGATISDSSGTGTITNDDPEPAGSVAIDDVTISEGDSGSKVATFTVTRSGGAAAFIVNFATSNGSASTIDNDYGVNFGTLHFAHGDTTQTISVTINGDTQFESDETFSVNLSGASNGASISDGSGTATIANDDPEPVGSVAIGDVAIGEGDSGSKVAIFTVTRSDGTAAFDVNFATADNSATVADSDYAAKSGTLHFDTNVNTQTVSVTINGDTKFEANEAFHVNLSGATNGATISDSQGIGTLQNDDLNRAPSDFNADTTSDVFWRNNSTGHVGTWEMHDNVQTWHDLGGSGIDHKVAGIGDFNGDGTADLFWRNDSTGHVGTWEMHDNVPTWHDLGGSGVDHKVVGIGDFNGDGTADLFWRNDTSGHVGTWEMHNNVPTWHDLGGSGVDHKVVGIGDFNADGTADVLWRNDSSGHVGIWEMHDNVQTWHDLGGSGVDHKVVGIGDFNGDGTADVLWRNDSSGHVGIWEMHDNVQTWHDLGGSGTDFKVAGIGDYNGDGTSDVFWRNDTDGHVGIWEMHNNVPTWHDLGLSSGVDHSFIV